MYVAARGVFVVLLAPALPGLKGVFWVSVLVWCRAAQAAHGDWSIAQASTGALAPNRLIPFSSIYFFTLLYKQIRCG